MIFIFSLFLGLFTGLRAMLPLAAVAWAAHYDWLHLDGSFLAFLASPVTAWVLTFLALGELVTDKLPFTPSRKVPPQFIGRVASGTLCGAALAGVGVLPIGALCGAVGAVLGTLGGAKMRAYFASQFGRDLPAALLEDAITVLGTVGVLCAATLGI